MMIKIQDEKGILYNMTENPAVVFDKECGTLYKIGEKETMLIYFNFLFESYRNAGYDYIANDLTFMELPLDQEEVDRVFQNTGYIKRLYEKSLIKS